MQGETYEEFVNKFKKTKKTTDDCYTPKEIYEVIKDWAVSEYKLDGLEVYRPFYPGGDYENFNYRGGVVIDNPPFSIMKDITEFYNNKNIKYFLFAPTLTLFNIRSKGRILIDRDIIYHNGAKVKTSFVTNLESCVVRSAPDLAEKISKAQVQKKKKRTQYKVSDNVITSARILKYANFNFKVEDGFPVSNLENMKADGRRLFGGGYIISDKDAQIFKEFSEIKKSEEIRYVLSEKERELVKQLNERGFKK